MRQLDTLSLQELTRLNRNLFSRFKPLKARRLPNPLCFASFFNTPINTEGYSADGRSPPFPCSGIGGAETNTFEGESGRVLSHFSDRRFILFYFIIVKCYLFGCRHNLDN